MVQNVIGQADLGVAVEFGRTFVFTRTVRIPQLTYPKIIFVALFPVCCCSFQIIGCAFCSLMSWNTNWFLVRHECKY